MTFLDIVTLFSYAALTADIVFQIVRVRKTHSSRDVSLAGITIRYIAILVIFYKFFTLTEWTLMVGQGLLMIVFTLYLVLAFYYHKHKFGMKKVTPKSRRGRR